jgi:hypothetical protein
MPKFYSTTPAGVYGTFMTKKKGGGLPVSRAVLSLIIGITPPEIASFPIWTWSGYSEPIPPLV